MNTMVTTNQKPTEIHTNEREGNISISLMKITIHKGRRTKKNKIRGINREELLKKKNKNRKQT